MRALLVVWAVVLCLGASGCEPEHYRADTQLLPDGSVERAIYQPVAPTPKKAQKSSAWAESQVVRKLDSPDQLRMPLNKLEASLRNPAKSETSYFFAKGKFADASEIPNYLVFEAAAGLKDGHLARTLKRRELGVVTEWIWEETLTDTVTLADQRLARGEAAELAIAITLAACADAWGSEYDLKPLEQWLRRDLVAGCQELCDINLQFGLKKNKTPADYDSLLVQGAKTLQSLGLDFFDDQGKLIKNQAEVRQRLERFISANLRKYVRDQQNQPLSDKLVQDTLDTLMPKNTEDVEDAKATTLLGPAFQRAIVSQLGTHEKFDQRVELLSTRIFGLYGWPPLQAARTLDYRLDVPGFIIETNGTLTGDRSLQWKFQAFEAFPLGYTMRAVIAVPNLVACKQHFPRAKFDQQQVVAEYVDFLQNDPTLQTALNQLVTKDEATAWKMWQADHSSATRLFELLQPTR